MANRNQSNRKGLASEDTKEKVVTRYDRKMEARRKQQEAEKRAAKRWKIGTTVAGICIVCAVAVTGIRSVVQKQSALNDTYMKIGDHELTKLEYDYYFNTTANNYINTYYSYLAYMGMGLDPQKDFDKQSYDGTLTWKDAFDRMTVNGIMDIKAMADDGQAQEFEYDVTENYDTYVENMKTSAKEAKVSLGKYYTQSFGRYATQDNVEPFIKEMLYASAYNQHLTESMRPSEEEITEYYEENKNNYDKVSYHVFQFKADFAEDATEEEKANAMEELNRQADEMIERLEAGEAFESLCKEYAKEEQKENYSNPETEYSYHADAAYLSTSNKYADWLYEENRTEGEVTKIENTDSSDIYVVRFDKRTYDESCRETISNSLASQRASDYLSELEENYEVTDVKGDLDYLAIQESQAESTKSEE